MAILVVTPILYWLLARNGASPTYAAILIGAILFGLLLQFSLGILSVVPRLHSDLSRIQKIDLTGAIVRLIVLVGCAFLFLNAAVALFVSAMAFLLQFWMLRRYAARVVDLDAPENAEDRTAMKGFIKNQAANAVFFCLQGQITVFLISFFREPRVVGGRGRRAGTAGDDLYRPGPVAPQRLRSRVRALSDPDQVAAGSISASSGGVTAFCLAVIGAAAFFPNQFLFVLGDKYSHLQHELLLMIAGTVMNVLTGTLWVLNASKGMDRRILALHSSYAWDTNSAYSLHRFLQRDPSIDLQPDLQRAESPAEHGPELSRIS